MKLLIFCSFLFLGTSSYAYNYVEHEEIGNEAMKRFYHSNYNSIDSIFWKLMPFRYDSSSQWYVSKKLTKFAEMIGYGTLNALSGDHTNDPLDLEDQLMTQSSSLLKIILLQNQYRAKYYTNAPDMQLFFLDYHYGLYPIFNMCHFYMYEQSLNKNVSDMDNKWITDIIDPAKIKKIFHQLNRYNAICMYLTVHNAAIYLAEKAGLMAKEGNPLAEKTLYYAFLYNSFADHFLEDCFSGGHLLVKRSVLGAAVNNKPIHDFYCKYGTEVVNKREEIWTAYGDNYFNHYHHNLYEIHDLDSLDYPHFTSESNRVIEAVHSSIIEVKEAFDRAYNSNKKFRHFNSYIPTDNDYRVDFFMKNITCMKIIPLPYGSNLNKIFKDTAIADNPKIIEANKIPYLRNYIRSRVANSLILGINFNYFLKETDLDLYDGYELRYNFKLLNSLYKFNPYGGKKGRVDIWNGFTIAMGFGKIRNYTDELKDPIQVVKGGFRTNFDIWLSDKRFLGLYTYNEIGWQRRERRNNFLYAPQVGIQLGSLFNINYYKMSPWIRIPLEYLLPLKLRFGMSITNLNRPSYFMGADLDLFF